MQMGLKTNHVKEEFKKLLWSSVSKLEAGRRSTPYRCSAHAPPQQ